MKQSSVKVIDPAEQAKAANYFVAHGGRRNAYFARAITVTPKRARKLLNRARREMNEIPTAATP